MRTIRRRSAANGFARCNSHAAIERAVRPTRQLARPALLAGAVGVAVTSALVPAHKHSVSTARTAEAVQIAKSTAHHEHAGEEAARRVRGSAWRAIARNSLCGHRGTRRQLSARAVCSTTQSLVSAFNAATNNGRYLHVVVAFVRSVLICSTRLKVVAGASSQLRCPSCLRNNSVSTGELRRLRQISPGKLARSSQHAELS